MKFTLSWLKQHLDAAASIDEVVEAMTMAGLEVEAVIDPSAKLAVFQKYVPDGLHPNKEGSLAVTWPGLKQALGL